ncbi:MAG: M48 family metalloprotease [Pseudomonadales bacterium]|jgi:predicted Zn-dependent protease|nr:M48 family metalloprotease [Pseudomonadales bacterium]MDP6471795.1 M48 family metalloprotease [Pseudomonadales bacterium]MDP6828791.1 M48 family metalloprotease [Pseudomonadales bacterium]MDP6970276.1 M48 family metalloprotease [Pseudomonadales bacterium]
MNIVKLLLIASLLSLGMLQAQAAGVGEKMYNDLREKDGLYPDDDWQDYVTEIGERLLAVSPDAGKNYTFCVVDNFETNASATGDGYIFVYRGIISLMKSEDELAGIIGHEIGHVVGGHSDKANSARRLGKLLGWIGTLGTGTTSMLDLSNTLTATATSRAGREFELESDSYGAEFLAKAGYDPLAMINAIYVLKDYEMFMKQVQNNPGVYHGLFASHPRNDRRLHEVVARAQPLAGDELKAPVRDFWEMINGLDYGDAPSVGITKDGVFYHSALRIVIAFPEKWTVSNSKDEVFGRSPGSADDAQITISRQERPDAELTPQAYIAETLKRDDVNNGETTTINGFDAYIGDVEVLSGNSAARKIAIVFKDGAAYLFKGDLAEGGDAVAFDTEFRATVGSFRAMKATDLQTARNQKIKVIVAEPGMTYAKLARQVSLQKHAEETLRLINGHHPRGEPRAGDYIKVIQ